MGEAKIRRRNTAAYLLQHPKCIHCGGIAETVDHCPPKSFFIGRNWPETFEFPACLACNAEGRLQEQVVALIVRTRHDIALGTQAFQEWAALENGVRNNSPEVIDEIFPIQSAVQRKRAFREAFGRERGDALRHAGGGVSDIGPRTQNMITGFILKLTRSLYYHHIHSIFEGAIYVRHYNLMQLRDPNELLRQLVALTPKTVEIKRAGRLLYDQFAYRYNSTNDGSMFFCVVQFSEQMVFHMIAMNAENSQIFEESHSPDQVASFGEKFSVRLLNGRA